MIPFGEWLPDQPTFSNSGSTEALNVIPRTGNSYTPLADLTAFSPAITARCQGAFVGRAPDTSSVKIFAGDATKLYSVTATAASDISVAANYTTGTEESWRFTQFNNRILATNFADPIQSYVMGTSTLFANLAAAAPKARHIANIRNFLVAANTYDASDGFQPGRVWWSAFENPTSWPTPGTGAAALAQSDYQDLSYGGWVNAVVGPVAGADAVVFMDTAIYRMTYEGPPTVFRFDPIENSKGTPAPGSVSVVGDIAFYLGEDGFYALTGAGSQPIGAAKVDKWFWSNVDQNYLHRITSAVDPINKLVFWSFPSTNAGGTPDSVLIYNFELGRWSHASVNAELIFRASSLGYTLEDLDSLGYTLDTLPFSLDSRVWTGGRPLLAAFDTSHKVALFTGSNLAATIDSGEFGGGTRIFVKGIRPQVDGGTVTCAVRYRSTPDGMVTTSTAIAAGSDGVCPFRISTRYARARVNIAAGGTWTHAQGVDAYTEEDGAR